MSFRYSYPQIEDYDTEEEFLEACEAYEDAEMAAEDAYIERRQGL